AYAVAFDEARALFEAHGSAAPVSASASDLDVVAKEAKQALWNVATGRNERARKSVSVVLDRAERALESLNREANAARNVLNACLYLVRAMAESDNLESARAHVLECRRLVPDIEPDPHDHPPEVLELVRKAEMKLATAGTATLRVKSEPNGCHLYVNGRRLGATPFTLRKLPPGEYRLQAECEPDVPARVHRVILAAEPTVVSIDTRLDTSVRTDGDLRLVYASPDTARKHRFHHAMKVTRATRSQTAVLLTPEPDEDALRLDRVDVVDEEVVASVRIGFHDGDAPRDEIAMAVEALREGRSEDLTSAEPAPMEPWEPPARSEATPKPKSKSPAPRSPRTRPEPVREPSPAEESFRAHRSVGWGLLGTGIAALASSWGLYAWTRGRGAEFSVAFPNDLDYLDRQARFDRARRTTGAVAGLAGVAATAGLPMALPADEGVPGWAWASGVVGAGLFAWGLVPFVAEDMRPFFDRTCVDANCTREAPTRLLGAMLWMHATPLLAVPLTYLLRPAVGNDAAVSFDLGPDRAALAVGGTF
ncbi:MAG: PEGA domain-containing protein, partial [Myxococcota bacterium]